MGYPVPAARHRTEQVIDRSRFIATVGRAADPDAARAFIDEVRAEFADATHNCWAYVAGPAGSSAHIGLSDAGEPHGTAGRPMLDVLLYSGIGEIVAVVTRYYGGVKLGTGGLVRAYGGAVQHALETLSTEEKVERVRVLIDVAYADIDMLKRTLDERGALVEAEEYGAGVTYDVAVPVSALDDLERELLDRTAGRAVLRRP